MISQLEIENFKAFGPKQRARFARITLIYGANSSGKSSLIQSLLLLKQSMEFGRRSSDRRMSPSGHLVDLGDSQSLIHRRVPTGVVRIGVGYSLPLGYLGMSRRLLKFSGGSGDDYAT